ncbi:ELL-associated factor 1-like [Papaver somniferum]|uniref:ELL-associated factor 1-like n=1 Tax=Papaver somniferum TaxID=3469 RepID=UPI000E6F88BC|nr:ELL-associated factor 1-like [Papaver somniferum]
MAKNNREEPSTAPQPDQWYNLTLGSSFKDDSSTKKFCTLRYEFKPASIDKNQPGSLHKSKDNKVTVEFHNNLPGKPNVTFEGSSEDYKDNDAVLFFDGSTFRLERLHRAVKRLRHVRLPGDSLNSALPLPSPAVPNQYSSSVDFTHASPPPPLGKSVNSRTPNKSVEGEQVGIGESDPEEGLGKKTTADRPVDDYLSAAPNSSAVLRQDPKSDEIDGHLDVIGDVDVTGSSPPLLPKIVNPVSGHEQMRFGGFDINLPSQNDSDNEIADVDVSDDEPEKGPNAAEALRAQVMNEEGGGHGTSSSDSSGSGSSGSDSASSSSDSEASEDVSITSD